MYIAGYWLNCSFKYVQVPERNVPKTKQNGRGLGYVTTENHYRNWIRFDQHIIRHNPPHSDHIMVMNDINIDVRKARGLMLVTSGCGHYRDWHKCN